MLGWVPIPISNDVIQQTIEGIYGEVLNIIHCKCRDGLLTGVRIVTIAKEVVENNPLPSYLIMQGHEIYDTYSGQIFTCKYCGEPGHNPIDCEKRKSNFPLLQMRLRKHSSTVDNPIAERSARTEKKVVFGFTSGSAEPPPDRGGGRPGQGPGSEHRGVFFTWK